MQMDNMWRQSYTNPKHRRMLFPDAPSGAGKQLLEFLDTQTGFDKITVSVLDIGCGNGRNAIALAQAGFGNVVGFDLIPEAITDAQERAKELGLGSLRFLVHDIKQPWPFESDTFDVAFDVNTFSSLSVAAREMYVEELARVMKKGGFFFLTTYSVNDGYYNQFVTRDSKQAHPGVQIICPDDAIKRVLYTSEEIRDLFGSRFSHFELSTHTWYGKMFDEYYKREFIALFFQRT